MERAVLSLILPVYNERDSVEAGLEQLRRAAAGIPAGTEIILVDDGSDDATAEILDELAAEGVRVIRHRVNRGYGAALKTGLRAASGEYVGITDADGTYPNERFPEFMAAVREGGYDMVVGARTGAKVKVPLLRRPAKWVLRWLANFLTGRRIPDLNSGMRVMKREAVERFIPILPDGFSFTTTITIAMMTNGYAVKFIPVDYAARKGKSKIRPIRDTLNFIQLICRTALYFNPLRVFLPLSAGLVLLAFMVLVGSWLLADRIMDVTFGVILMAAFVVLAIGLLADLIDKRTQV